MRQKIVAEEVHGHDAFPPANFTADKHLGLGEVLRGCGWVIFILLIRKQVQR